MRPRDSCGSQQGLRGNFAVEEAFSRSMLVEGEDMKCEDNGMPSGHGCEIVGHGFGARAEIAALRFEEGGIFGRVAGFDDKDDGGRVLARVEKPNGGREASVTDLHDGT